MDAVDRNPKGTTPAPVLSRVARGRGLRPSGGGRSGAGECALLGVRGGMLGSGRLSLGRAQE